MNIDNLIPNDKDMNSDFESLSEITVTEKESQELEEAEQNEREQLEAI